MSEATNPAVVSSDDLDMEELPKVYVPNFLAQNDYSKAEEIGELVYMTRGVVTLPPEKLHDRFEKFFRHAESTDVLLLSGNNLVCSIAYAEWMKRFPESRYLAVHEGRKKDTYKVYQIIGNP